LTIGILSRGDSPHLGHHVPTLLGDALHGFLGDEEPVIKGLDAAVEQTVHGAVGKGVRAHIGPPVGRGLDDGADLLLGVLRGVDGVETRGAAAPAHDLDLRGPVAQVQTGRLEHLGHAVGHRANAHALEV
jgi:hypothetical protein